MTEKNSDLENASKRKETKALIEEIELGGKFKSKTLFTVVIKYIATICILLILVSSVLDGLGIAKI